MFFDGTVQSIRMDILSETDHVILQFLLAITIPGPKGPQGILPAGVLKIPLSREDAIEKAKELLEAAEALPEPKPESDLVVVGNMDQAAQVAEMDKQIRDGEIPGT